MAISIIKPRDPGSYKKFVTRKSCSYVIQDIRTHHDSSSGYKYTSISIKKGVNL